MNARLMLDRLPAELVGPTRYVLDGECIRWNGPTNGPRSGYGLVVRRIGGVRSARMAHRVAYECVYGPIPDGMVLDHFRVGTGLPCIGRLCGLHTSPTTVRHNNLREGSASITAANLRKTHCSRAGHPYTPENTYTDPEGQRECRTCRATRGRRPALIESEAA